METRPARRIFMSLDPWIFLDNDHREQAPGHTRQGRDFRARGSVFRGEEREKKKDYRKVTGKKKKKKKKYWVKWQTNGARRKGNLDKGWSGSRLTRLTFVDSPIELSIDPRGETVFRMVARCASGGRTAIELRRYHHRQTVESIDREACRSSKENLSLVETRIVLEQSVIGLCFALRTSNRFFLFFFFLFFVRPACSCLFSGGDTTCSFFFFFFFFWSKWMLFLTFPFSRNLNVIFMQRKFQR